MGDLIGDGDSWLAGVQRSHVSRAVDYVTPSLTVEDVPATVGATQQPVEQAGGIHIIAQTRDYLIHASDLVDGSGNQIEPVRGHQIKETDSDGTVHIYQVGARSDSDDVWVWAGPNRIRRRIYTTYMGVA